MLKLKRCRKKNCDGVYEERFIEHAGIQDVPAEVCTVCGERLLRPETVRWLEKKRKET